MKRIVVLFLLFGYCGFCMAVPLKFLRAYYDQNQRCLYHFAVNNVGQTMVTRACFSKSVRRNLNGH